MVVTGLVPVEKQVAAFRRALMDAVAYDPETDTPTYDHCIVERAEINSPDDVKNPNFTAKFDSSEEQSKARKGWPTEQLDVVEQKYVDPVLTFPLGPLTHAWGKNVAHDPEIPLMSAETFGAGQEGDNPGERARGDARTMRGQLRAQPVAATQATDYKLLRFFDFSVEPGKTYVYRVSLALKNPNFGFDAAKLKKDVSREEKFLSPTVPEKDKPLMQTVLVDVPKDTQVFVGVPKSEEAAAGKFPVVLLTWVQKNGRSAYMAVPNVDRGQVLNITGGTATPVVVESTTGPGPAGPAADTDDIKTDFITDTALLDMDGGKKLNIGKGKPIAPREMLFMAVNGKTFSLKLRDELDDLAEVNRITTKTETPTERRGPGPGPRGVDPRNLLRGPGGGER